MVRDLVARLESQSVHGAQRVIGVPAVPALLLGLLLAPNAVAQGVASQGITSEGAVEAEAAYRAGDYAVAAAGFARAAAVPGADRRLHYNLGNSLFRQGQLGEALVAYERARLAMPRDSELLANIRLVKQRLELGTGEGEPFLDAVDALRASFTGSELLLLCVLCNAVAALGLVWLRSHTWLRVVGYVAVVPALLLTLEVVWLGPARPPAGIVVTARAALVAEPRDGLEPVLELREGVAVELLSAGPAWVRVRVSGRSGYVPTDSVGVVE